MDNAKVGAGSRQRRYQKAGRVKRAGSKRSEYIVRAGSKRSEYIVSPGKQNTGETSAGAKQDFAVSARKCAAYMCVCE